MDDLFSRPEPKVLRPYQQEAIQRLRLSLGSGKRRPVLQLATGGGKTLIAANIIRMAREKGKRVAFFVPALSLVSQTVSAFRDAGISGIGVLQGDHALTDLSAPVQVATVQTFGRREVLPHFDFALVDECHIRSAALEAAMGQDKVFVGLTATPWAKGLGLVYDDLVVGSTISQLMDGGYLCRFRAFAAAHPDLSGVKTVAGEFHQGQLSDRMSETKLVADVVSTWLRLGEGRPTLCFAVDVAHARKLSEDFIRAGVSAAYVEAATDSVERENIRRRFVRGDLKVVCNCRTLTTGVDWPVGCIIDAAPTRSEMLHVQKIGRGLRVNPGIEDLIILDHADNSLRLGFVTEIHHDALDGSKRTDAKPEREIRVKLPKECTACGFLKPAGVHECPSCGFTPMRQSAVQHEDGDLVQIKGKPRPPTMAEKQRFYSMALSLAAERGKLSTFAAGLYKGKFGVWPRGMLEIPTPPDATFRAWEKSRRIAYAKRKEAERA
jgi:DNA repair protein RadD